MYARILLVSLALALIGCQAAPDTETSAATIDCSAVTVPKYSELTIWPLCTSCHSSAVTGAAREKAPSNVNFDTYAAAQAQAARAVLEVRAGAMPEKNEPQPTDEQKTALYTWAACGTPN